jgi:CubicO group peptidase (beta-lactamase class C family)
MNRNVTTCLALIIFAAVARAQTAPQEPVIPDTPAGRLVREWLRAARSGDTVLVLDYVRRYEAQNPADTSAVEDIAGQILGFKERSGGFTVKQILHDQPEELILLLQTAHGRGLRLRYGVEQAADGSGYRAATVGLRPDEPEERPESVPPRLSDEAMARLLGERLDIRAAEDRFSGALLVAHDGRLVFRAAYGIADRRTGARNTPDTKFTLASMGKTFTAVAIAQLVEQGKVVLDSPIARYLPDYPNADFARRATVRHLLSHTSGLGSYWNRLYDERRTTLTTIASHLPLFVNDPLPFAPGTRFRYSNAGFQVLGLIVERVSGQSYYDFVRDHLFAPAGMTNTGYYGTDGEVAGGAVGYTRDGPAGALSDNLGSRELKGGAAGGGYSTVEDLRRFAEALTSGRLIRAETLQLFTTPSDNRNGHGLGFVTQTHHGHRSFGHSGGAPGMGTNLVIVPDLGYIAVILTNYDPPLMRQVDEMVREMVTSR